MSAIKNRPASSILPYLVLLASLALLSGCERAAPPPAQAEPGPPAVSVAAAIERDIIETDEFPGRLEAVDAVEIRARVNGYLESIHFEPGAIVKKGELLFVIDPRPFAARLAEAAATRANTQAELDLARTELTRQAQMLGDRATSKREYDTAQAAVKSLEAALRANQAASERARLDLEYTRVTSPIDGRVGKDEITVGNLVQGDAPDSPVLTTVVSVDPIYATFQADESAFLKYIGAERGAALEVKIGLANDAGFPHTARLEFVDNSVDPTTGTVRMRAVLDNQDGRFTPGLFARVALSASAAARRAVLVADRAIGTDQSKRFVLVVNDDRIAQYREVRTGRIVGGLRVIESGLEPGEIIVVNGLQRVRPGNPVTPETVSMEDVPAAPAANSPPGAG